METSLKYPVGDFERPEKLNEDQRSACIRTIVETPAKLKAAVSGLMKRSWKRHTGRADGRCGRWSITWLTAT